MGNNFRYGDHYLSGKDKEGNFVTLCYFRDTLDTELWLISRFDQDGNVVSRSKILPFKQILSSNNVFGDTLILTKSGAKEKIYFFDFQGNLLKTIDIGENIAYGPSNLIYHQGNIYLGACYAMFGNMVVKLNHSAREWIWYTPTSDTMYGSIVLLVDIDKESGDVYFGSQFMIKSTPLVKSIFCAGKLDKDGKLKWIKFWYPPGDWRKNVGNWVRDIKFIKPYVIFCGLVEKKRTPLDINSFDSYLVVLNSETGEILKEDIFISPQNGDYLRYESYNMNIPVVLDNNSFILFIVSHDEILKKTNYYLRFYRINQVTSVKEEKPLNFVLYQNYPNPFNSETTISYEIPARTYVKLVIYNVLGQKVATLVDEIQEPGKYRIKFDANGLPSGVYIYRLEAGGYIEKKKMILIK